MSVLVDSSTRVICQGFTGRQGTFHSEQAIAYGTDLVGGVTPGARAARSTSTGPVFNTVHEAVREVGRERDDDLRARGLRRGRHPRGRKRRHRGDRVHHRGHTGSRHAAGQGSARRRSRYARLIGPNCPGHHHPRGQCKIGIMPGAIHTPGSVGIVSRSGTLTYEAVHQTSGNGLGQSTCIGIGGDPIHGMSFIDCLALFQSDHRDRGDRHGRRDRRQRRGGCGRNVHRARTSSKPVVAYIAGVTAPPGRRMGHAGRHHLRGQGDGRGEVRRARVRGSAGPCARRRTSARRCARASADRQGLNAPNATRGDG